ncbi:MAG: molybdopterin-dependent oxidoreductase [Verrucomicrobiales bacterium]|nr:molybdopterin-dependent oxidoreductase [Verrucomicrobiales bacterium]
MTKDKFSRRDLIKLGSGIVAGGFLPATSAVNAAADGGAKVDIAKLIRGKIDYTKAKATPTICFGCTTHCGVIGWVQDGRVRKMEGNPLDPNSKGNICAKAQGVISATYYPERLLYPLKRVGIRGGGKWKRISWDEALTEIADKMRPLRENNVPEEFVFHYGRDKTKGYTKHFTNAFGTPHRLNRRSICSSNRRAPLMSFYGREFEWETQDFENTKYIINFGGNPMEAYQGGLFMMHRIRKAQAENNAKMVTFEVRPSATASVSEEYHPVMPGTDGAIAMAMIHVILGEGLEDKAFWERWSNYPLEDLRKHVKTNTPEWAEAITSVPAADIKRIAIEFAKAAPYCTTMSNRGSAKHYNGVQADRAIRMLDVLVGNVGKPGGFCLSSLRGWANRYGQDGLPKLSMPGPKPSDPKPWGIGEGFNEEAFRKLPEFVQERVNAFPDKWRNSYYGELATPSEYPLAWHWYQMRVGQLVYPYIKEGRQKVSVYMSFTLGAAYGYPEANAAREVLLDEELIPYHIAIDIGYGEQTALADIILPEATALERWDHHSTNNYGLIPYTGVRQPLVKPAGETKSVQVILRDLARKIGGGMEQYFIQMEDMEAFYKEWYKNLPVDWGTFKKRGIWQDETRAKDYELYEKQLTGAELEGSEVGEDGIISKDGKAIGLMQGDKAVIGFETPSRKIQVYDEIWPIAAKAVGLPMDDVNASPIAIYDTVPEHRDLPEDRYIFSTFKWNVHTQGRSGHWKYNAEIIHTNPVFMHPETGKTLGVSEGDTVKVSVYRPTGATYRSGEPGVMNSFENHVRFLKGMHPRVVMCSHHVGHWEHGAVGRSENQISGPVEGLPKENDLPVDRDIPKKIWWAKKNGGIGGGVHINDALPINPCPLTGGQNWYDNVCSIEKVS